MSCISCVTLCSCSGCEEQWVGFQLLHQVRLCWSTQNAARWLYELHWLCDIARCNDCVVAVVVKNTDAKSCVLRSWLSLSVSCETLKRDPNHNVTICTPLQVSISPSIVSQVTTQSQGPVKAALQSNFFLSLYHQDHLHQRHHKISLTAAVLHLNHWDFGRDAVRRTDRDQIGNSLWINSNDSLSISGQSPGLIFGQYLDNSFNICPDRTEATVTYGGALRHVSPQIVSRGTTPPAETTKPPKQIAEPLKKHLWSKSHWWAARSRAHMVHLSSQVWQEVLVVTRATWLRFEITDTALHTHLAIPLPSYYLWINRWNLFLSRRF